MKKRVVSFSLVMVALFGMLTLGACPKEQQPATLVDAGPAAGSVGDALGTGISGSAHQAPGESDIGKLAADAVILKVDGVTYTKQRLDQAIIQTGLAAGIPPAMLDGASKIAFEKPAYEKLIERQLLIGEAKKRKLFPTMEEADAQTKGDRDRVIAQLPPGKTFADMLKEMGTDEAQYQSELQNDVAIARLLQSMEKAITEPSEEALKKVYEDNKAYMGTPETASVSHVLIALPEGAPEADVKAATAKAEAIAKEAKGKDKEAFAKLAEEKSEDPMAKKSRGDLGTFAKGDLLPEIEKVAFALKDGEVSAPVRSNVGLHVLRGQGLKPARMRSFDEVKQAIVMREKQKQLMGQMDTLLDTLRAAAKIERVVEPAKSPFEDRDGKGSQVVPPGAGARPPAPAPH
jgi:parvulin-like peptidyl-prolyl isomerase